MVRTSPPVTADRYRLHERLGGTAGRVHRAHDVLLQRDVAVKTFPGPDGRERWERDALLRERLGPGRAMEVLDGAPDGADGPFVVMPLARDGSLDAASTPCDPAWAAVLVARLAAGLGRLHRRGVVHGGVGPDAVLLDPALGPRWTGDGAPARAGASADDDVTALAGVAVLAATGPLPVVPAPSADVVAAVRALVADAADVAARERLRDGLAAHAPRRAPAPGRVRARRVASSRPRRAVLAACVGAVVLGGALGTGVGVTGGDASAAIAGDAVGRPALFHPAPASPAYTLVVPAAPVEAGGDSPAAAAAKSGAGGGGASSPGMRATSSGVGERAEDRSGSRSEQRAEQRSEDRAEDRHDSTEQDDESASGSDDADRDDAGDSGRDRSDADADGDSSGDADSGSGGDSGGDPGSGSEADSGAEGPVGELLDAVL
ncbi:hypothetical protein ACFPK1_03770 [Actinomycetospora rhizophila]|uniref:Protein kinase domain-containing protein n=1 Tax=Actinomycetospora rhizophila TaxID=1416876 RepID=A0ABV9ZAF8_9PSEU